jgi:hypothetical protein
MKYDKPEIQAIGPAIVAVKGKTKGIEVPTDNRQHLSPSAYEADE